MESVHIVVSPATYTRDSRFRNSTLTQSSIAGGATSRSRCSPDRQRGKDTGMASWQFVPRQSAHSRGEACCGGLGIMTRHNGTEATATPAHA